MNGPALYQPPPSVLRIPRVGIASTLIVGVIAEAWIFTVPARQQAFVVNRITFGVNGALTGDDTNYALYTATYYDAAGTLIDSTVITTQATTGTHHTGSLGAKASTSWEVTPVRVPGGGSIWYAVTKAGGGKITPGVNLTFSS